jgi:mitochondrial chaperone BCS1
MTYLPASHTTFTFWYKRRWVRINRMYRENTGYYGGRVEQLSVCIMSWDHNVLNQMLLEAKKAYKDAQEHSISIYVSDS